MDIRRLTPDDAPAYRSVRIRALGEYPEAFTSSYEEEVERPIEDTARRLADPNITIWGAWDGEDLAGMVGLARETRAKNRHKATVIGMYVGLEHLGSGLGRRMFEVLLEEARQGGIEVLVLTVTDGNTTAIRIYESVGFRSFGIEPKAIKVDGRYFAKNHMVLDLTQQTP